MRIVLKNFKQHTDLELEFPDTGMIRLSGVSGVGKSTVFEAIDFAINGSGQDLVTWGKKSGSVLLEVAGMIITRTKRPDSLLLLYDGQEYREDHAQEQIYSVLGISSEEYEVSAYVRQGQTGSILNLKPADQLRFVQRLTDHGIDPDKYKQFLSSQQKAAEKDLSHTQELIANKTLQYQSVTQKVSTLQGSLLEPVKPAYPTGLTYLDCMRRAPEISNEIDACRKILDIEIPTLRQAVIDFDLNTQKKADLLGICNTLDGEISVLHNQSLQLTTVSAEERARAARWQNYHAQRQKLQNYVNELKTFYQVDFKSASEFLNECIAVIQKDLTDASSVKAALNQQISDLSLLKTPQNCPDCGSGLMVVGGVIQKHKNTEFQKQIQSITQELKRLEIEKVAPLSAELQTTQKRVLSLKMLVDAFKEASKDLGGSLTVEAADQIIQIAENEASQRVAVEATIKEKINQKTTTLAHLSIINNKIAGFGSVSPSDVEAKAVKASKTIDALTQEREWVLVLIEQWRSYYTGVTAFERALQQYNQGVAMLRSMEAESVVLVSDINNLKSKSHTLFQKVTKLTSLIDMVEKAAVEAIENTLDLINSSAEQYLDAMFPEGLSIRLLNHKVTKKGDERAKIDMEIIHKEQKIPSLKSFSGGQRSRIFLAFQLSLSSLYNCPFLLVDEGLTGVDIETQRECLEFLREFSQQKLILVIEHHAEKTLFDEEVSL